MDRTDRAAVRMVVVEDLSGVVDDVVDTIRGEIPAYAALSKAQMAEVSAIASWGIGRVLDLWVFDEQMTADDTDRFRGIGAARALDGRPLPGVLRAYRLAGRSIIDKVTQAARETLTVADALALANLWMTTIDVLSEALYAGHTHAADRVAGDREQALADLLGDLLDGRQVTLTALADRGRQLGVVLAARPTVVVVESISADEPLAAETLSGLLEEVDLAGDEAVLRAARGRRAVMVADAMRAAAISSAVARFALRGCAVGAARANDVHRAYRLAALCLDMAPDHSFSGRAVLDEGDAQVLALLNAHPLADAVRARECILRSVAEPQNAHLLEGVDAFLAHGSATAAARHLGLHAQTMRYRLTRFCDLTRRDLRRPWDRFVVEASRRARS